MIPLKTDRLVIRNWQEGDRDLFHEINSDPQVMQYFPFRRDRSASDAKMDELRDQIEERGMGFTALELKETGETIGFAGLHRDALDIFPPETIEIGWRLAVRHWGKGYVTEAGRELLRWGFEDLKLPRVICFAVAGNARSIAVMHRLGLRPRAELDFDHPLVDEARPDLRRHVFYELTREQWLADRHGSAAANG
ncbi:GNAT family N-acetyltransferase [Pararhizobium haloflavum]|uniref:GNAT family N-acetyltransferase n=1 Tax=Pararhizobium haloflavum TaxID=2037914 RepID=UPI000C185655|nr:GNAT family N-acetyltransferase [Pararhizobium haloflavum]